MKYSDAIRDVFQNELINIIGNNDVESLKQLMSSPTFSTLTREQIDSSAFQVAYFTCEHKRVHDSPIINYLIFDYGIKEENSIDLIKVTLNPVIKNMFAARRLQSELSVELDINSKPNKKPKV
jgi:hypothetical protein